MQEQVETREMPCFPPRAELLLRASRHPLAALMRDALDACGVATDETLLLLISGGGDSMAMLLDVKHRHAKSALFANSGKLDDVT